jgi:hypothetical protein
MPAQFIPIQPKCRSLYKSRRGEKNYSILFYSIENGTYTGGARTTVPQISGFTLYLWATLGHETEAKFLISKKTFCPSKMANIYEGYIYLQT